MGMEDVQLVRDVAEIELEEEEDKYNQMEKFLQPKDPKASMWELAKQSLGLDLAVEEREAYCKMLKKYPNFFITSYKEIRGFKGKPLKIGLKRECKTYLLEDEKVRS